MSSQTMTKYSKFGTQFNTPKFVPKFNAQEISKTLAYTKPCNNVLRKICENTGNVCSDYGVCQREVCTFAHSLSELKLPPCGFGDKCNRKHGSMDPRTRKIDTSRKCQFFHPCETTDQFYLRTGSEKPDLPQTSEKSWLPKSKQMKEAMKAEQEKAIADIAEKLEEVRIVKEENSKDKLIIPIQVPETLIIRVPHELAEQALQVAISRGFKDFKIETF